MRLHTLNKVEAVFIFFNLFLLVRLTENWMIKTLKLIYRVRLYLLIWDRETLLDIFLYENLSEFSTVYDDVHSSVALLMDLNFNVVCLLFRIIFLCVVEWKHVKVFVSSALSEILILIFVFFFCMYLLMVFWINASQNVCSPPSLSFILCFFLE